MPDTFTPFQPPQKTSIRISFALIFVILAATNLIEPSPACAQIYPSDQSAFRTIWMDYWEINRNTDIQLARQAFNLPSNATKPKVPAAVIDALVEATSSNDGDLRIAATTALGRIGGAVAAKRIAALRHDKDERVRCRAIVAMGLLGQEKILLADTFTSEAENLAGIAAIVLLPNPSVAAIDRIRGWAKKSPRPETIRMCIWALRVRGNKADRQLFLDMLRQTKYPPIAIEAINGIGAIGDPADLAALTEIATAGPMAKQLPVFAAMARLSTAANRPDMYSWVDEIMRLRAAAAVAMGQIKPGPRINGGVNQDRVHASTALQNMAFAWDPSTDGPARLYQGAATLALPSFGDASVALDLLNSKWPEGIEEFSRRPLEKNTQQRYLAAISLGQALASRNAKDNDPDPGWVDQGLDPDVIISNLQSHMMLPGEAMPVRVSSALALGLSHNPTVPDILIREMHRLNPANDFQIWGQAVLALGLLHDARTLDAAAACVGKPEEEIDIKRVLASDLELSEAGHLSVNPDADPRTVDRWIACRAIATGLEILGDRRAGPLLMSIWGRDRWSSVESARAMGACGNYNASTAMVSLLKQKDAPHVAIIAAISLGELFDPDHPSRMDALSDGNCYSTEVEYRSDKWIVLKSDFPRVEREFHALGNPFLYNFLLPTHKSLY